MDVYWAKDIQELFRLERRRYLQRFVELIMAQSGGIFEATWFTRPCEVSRSTISNYLAVLEATFVFHVIRPFSTHRPNEIIAAPKVYGFDTGFVCYHRGNRHRLRNLFLFHIVHTFSARTKACIGNTPPCRSTNFLLHQSRLFLYSKMATEQRFFGRFRD